MGVKDYVITIKIDLDDIRNPPAGTAPSTTDVVKHEVLGHGGDYDQNPVEATFESNEDAEKHAKKIVKDIEKDKRKEDMTEEKAEEEVRKMAGLPARKEIKKDD